MEVYCVNKRLFFLFTLIFLFVFACDLETPKEVRIYKETPELNIEANTDEFSLEELFDLDFDGIDYGTDPNVAVLDCINKPNLTKMIYIKLYEGDLEADSSIISGLISMDLNIDNDTGSPIPVITGTSVTVNSPDFSGSLLESFALSPLQSRLYISGDNHDFIDILLIELEIDGVTKEYSRSLECAISDAEFISGDYLGTSLPPGDNDFEMTLNTDQEINLNISIAEDAYLPAAQLRDLNILIEIAVWLPFELTVTDPAGYELPLPFDELFSEGGDLFGRESGEEDSVFADAIESMHLKIILSSNPFSSATLLVTSPGCLTGIGCIMNGNSIIIDLDKDMIKYPFIPGFSIKFEYGDTLAVPRVFSIKELAFKAKLKFEIEL
jgi:hypothetical protein